MERKYIYGGVALVVVIFILFLIMRKKGTDSSSSPGDTNVGPTIEVGDLQATQNPDKTDNTTENTKTESYMIQKTEGYDATAGNFDDKELSKNIQLGLTWSNGGGWDNITKIKVKWEQKVPDDTDDSKTKNVVRMEKEIIKGTDANANYFMQYQSGLTHTFTANDGLTGDSKFSAVGENMIHVYYVDKDGNDVRLTPDTVATFVVTVDMLSATKDLLSAKTFTYKPTTGTATISATIAETEYYLYNNAIKKDMIQHISGSAKEGKVMILPEGENADNSIVRLKVKLTKGYTEGKEYFLMRGSDDGKIVIKDVTDVASFTEHYKFEVVAGTAVEDGQPEFVRFRRVGDANKDKFMMVDFADTKLKIKSYTGIEDACTNKSLDFILSSTEQTDRAADCVKSE